MRTALATTVLMAILLLASALPATATPPTATPPTANQIARAVAAAERSRSLWATINICNSPADRRRIGVRGQMPSLGLPAAMYMTVKLSAYSTSAKRFVPINSRNAIDTISLGTHTHGLEQDGTVFPFMKGQTGLWNATVVFTWKRGGKVLGRTQRTTTAGHTRADFGNPPHYSAAQCRIS